MNIKDFSCEKKYPVKGCKGRTVYYSPNLLNVFDWICQYNGVKKYRRARLWNLYKMLEMVDFVGTDDYSLKVLRANMICYSDYSTSVIESDLRLLGKLGLVVESQTDNALDYSALLERSGERLKWEDSIRLKIERAKK